MSIPGVAAGAPPAVAQGWAELAHLVARTVYDVYDLARAAMDAIESAVNLPLSASSPTVTCAGPSRAAGGVGSSNDPTPGKLPLPHDSGTSEVDAEHAAVWSLVQAAQQGDGEAFGKLYDQYVDGVFRFIYYRVNDRALAEDFTSETFLRALRRISSINYQGRDIGAWFITIARNIVFDHTKSARFRMELTTGDLIEGSDVDAGPEYAVLTNLTNTRLLEAVNSLGEEQKECIVLRFLNGLSVAETASVMGKNDGAIKALQHRAVKRLASVLGDELK
jgi:RNA polymerase sigma-70 factor (ECF subfamily)